MRGVRTTFLGLLACAVFLAAVLVGAPAAKADGKMFAVEVADVSGAQIPDQAAMICWDPATKMQTLAIETRFVGKGTDFGWVVPLPSRPEVKPGTKGMFPSLRGIFAPVVQREAGTTVTVVTIMLLIGAMLLLYFPLKRAVAVGVGLSALATLFLLPALGKPRGISSIPIAEPEFVDRRIVGDFEVTTLESPEGSVVVDWLRSHKFHVPAAAETVIDQYAKEKWSFVATRLVREGDTAEASTAHPLVFTFATNAPVYPMRLTGADANRDLSVELFVFGPSRATAPAFKAAAAGPVEHIHPDTRWVLPSPEQINVAHSALRPLTKGAQFATRLTAMLTPAQMTRDVPLNWTAGGAKGRSVYGATAVKGIALASACVAGLIALVAIGLIERRRGWKRGIAILGAVAVAVPCAAIVAAVVPAVPSVRVRGGESSLEEAVAAARSALYDLDATLTLSEARERLDAFLSSYNARHQTDFVRGDAPGQIEVRARFGSIELVSVNIAGSEVIDSWICSTDDADSEPTE